MGSNIGSRRRRSATPFFMMIVSCVGCFLFLSALTLLPLLRVEAFSPICTNGNCGGQRGTSQKQLDQAPVYSQRSPFFRESSRCFPTRLSFQRPWLQHDVVEDDLLPRTHQNRLLFVGSTNSPNHKTIRSSTELAAARGRPPKKGKSSGDPAEPDDDWVDAADGILGDFDGGDDAVDDDDDVDGKGTKATASANYEDDDDDYDEDDDDALDELNIDDDDDDDDELEIEEEMIGEYDDDGEGEWDEDEDYILEDDDVEWDEDEDGGDYELEDDEDDPNYMKQKELVQEAAKQADIREREESFDALDFIMNEMTEEQAEEMDQLPIIKETEERTRDMMLEAKDLDGIDIEQGVKEVSDLMDDDPYPRYDQDDDPDEVNFLEIENGLTDDDMEELDRTYKRIHEKVNEEPWDKVMVKDMEGWDDLSEDTLTEMEACLEEIGGSAYNVSRWLLYDLDFNVSNLILSAIQHNPEAPIIFQHWYPQLVTYERYQHVRDRDYDFDLEDVENADISELERYYLGFGYKQIPKKMPAETGIISLEYMDEEEIKMAAFENWMKEVYNPEWDRKDFDDDEMRDEDNVFSNFYVPPQHPDLPTFQDALDDIEDWHDEIGHDGDENMSEEMRQYRDMMGEKFEYTVKLDKEFQKEFRGHLIIACTGDDEDLEIAEKITLRFTKEFGKQVYVETRVEALARQEDNVFEVWLESYEIDLLHSKKRATSNTKGWTGPAECDDKQIDYLVDRVRFLISDDARYSYRMMDMDLAEY